MAPHCQAFGPHAETTEVKAFCDNLGAVKISDTLFEASGCADVKLLVGWALESPASDAEVAKVAT